MLATTNRTRSLLAGGSAQTPAEYAAQQSARSIRRFLEKKNRMVESAGCRYEYDGRIIRCVTMEAGSLRDRIARYEKDLIAADPLCNGMSEWFLSNIQDNVIWWHDLPSLEVRYGHMKSQILKLAISGHERLRNVPVVIGGDWEFNAWAGPAQPGGDFIMMNLGFIQAYCYAAMFFEMLDEYRESSEKGQAKGIITSSMLWMAATALGYESLQWGNLSLPPSESDRIWRTAQKPPEEIARAIAAIDGFAMLHECGHIACGHTDRSREWRTEESLTEPERADRYAEMRAFEFEADRFACQSLLTTGPVGTDCFHALLILFSMLRLCEGQRDPQSSLTSTHPSGTDRLRRCFETLGHDADREVHLLEAIVQGILHAARRRVEWQERLRE